ncbi:hypothetical protein [Nostoc sp. PCC 9305]|uniref:hypothetical protein n=1 Tax=Nostoc sp. PCC 9305 TaxID=296636 RepID=UPI0039C62DA1
MTTSVEHGLNNSAFIPPLESGDRSTRHEFERRYTGTYPTNNKYFEYFVNPDVDSDVM